MRVVKSILSLCLLAVSLTVLAAAGYFLWTAMAPKPALPPAMVDPDSVYEEEAAEAPPVDVTSPEDAVEKAPEEEPQEKPEEPKEEPGETETPGQQLLQRAKTLLADMTLEEKLWQLFIVTPEALTGVNRATRAGDTTRDALAARPVGGLVYFAANLEDREQTVTMLGKTQSYAKTGLFLCVDEEGGAVSRVGSNEAMGVTHFAAAAEFGSRGSAAEVYDVGASMGQQLTELGFNLNFAPVADVITNEKNTEIGDRAYSGDPQLTGELAAAMVKGLKSSDMASCLKHFPGHGSTEADSHAGTSVSHRTLDELRETEWIPFRQGIEAGVPFVMLSHLTNGNLSSLPSSLSPEVVTLLRQELGFSGIIITDSQQMGAITDHYTAAEAAVKAVTAGADMILMPADLQQAHEGLQLAVRDGLLTERRIDESVLRILLTKLQYGIIS